MNSENKSNHQPENEKGKLVTRKGNNLSSLEKTKFAQSVALPRDSHIWDVTRNVDV